MYEVKTLPVLGSDVLDNDHDELFGMITLLRRASEGEFVAQLSVLRHKAQLHFAYEDAQMACGDFPTRQCHLDEHAAVLASIEEVLQLVAKGDFLVGQRLAVELEHWFPAHIEALDQALTQWLFKCATGGGNAVVFRR